MAPSEANILPSLGCHGFWKCFPFFYKIEEKVVLKPTARSWNTMFSSWINTEGSYAETQDGAHSHTAKNVKKFYNVDFTDFKPPPWIRFLSNLTVLYDWGTSLRTIQHSSFYFRHIFTFLKIRKHNVLKILLIFFQSSLS